MRKIRIRDQTYSQTLNVQKSRFSSYYFTIKSENRGRLLTTENVQTLSKNTMIFAAEKCRWEWAAICFSGCDFITQSCVFWQEDSVPGSEVRNHEAFCRMLGNKWSWWSLQLWGQNTQTQWLV